MEGVALALVLGGAVIIRGALQGLTPVDSFRDIFARALPKAGAKAPQKSFVPLGGSGSSAGEFEVSPGGNGDQFPPNVERWRGLVAAHFPAAKVNEALSVMDCESEGNPSAVNPLSGASGLFQHMPMFWSDRSTRAGVPGASVFNAAANVQVAGWLYRQSHTWAHWSCKPSV